MKKPHQFGEASLLFILFLDRLGKFLNASYHIAFT
jgi:hypothetical protein